MAEKKAVKAEPLNIDSLLGHVRNRISRVGIEVEGGWDPRYVPQGVNIEHDGSVQIPPNGPIRYMNGEIASEPMAPARYPLWMKKFYPTAVNETCGLHVHMSFESIRHYASLMIPEYQETICEYLSRWAKEEGIAKSHHIWGRLEGKSRFCRKNFWPEMQAKQNRKDHDQEREGNRYTLINYCHGLHGTLECRVLPMFDNVETSIHAVKAVLDITNACVLHLGKERDKGTKVDVVVPDDSIVEYVEEIF